MIWLDNFCWKSCSGLGVFVLNIFEFDCIFDLVFVLFFFLFLSGLFWLFWLLFFLFGGFFWLLFGILLLDGGVVILLFDDLLLFNELLFDDWLGGVWFCVELLLEEDIFFEVFLFDLFWLLLEFWFVSCWILLYLKVNFKMELVWLFLI